MDPAGQDAAQASSSARASPMMRRQGRMNGTNTGESNSPVSSTASPQEQQQFYHQASYPTSTDSTHLQQPDHSTSPTDRQELPASLHYPPGGYSSQANFQPRFRSEQRSFISEDDISRFSHRADIHSSSSQSPLVHPSTHSRTSDGKICLLGSISCASFSMRGHFFFSTSHNFFASWFRLF